MKYYCAMDVGGTSARLQIKSADGSVLGEFIGTGCTLNVDGNEVSEQRYRDIVLPSLEKLELKPENCLGLCAAASGVDTEQNAVDCKNYFVRMGFLPQNIRVCNDCEVFLLSSDEPDMIVISGTGSIAVGRKTSGEFVRCGGWGHIISDEGSAYIMAVKIFRAVSRYLDDRENCPILAEMLLDATGFTSPVELNLYLTENMTDRKKVACYAKLAEDAAERGDEGAQKILEECADELYGLVEDTRKKLGKAPDEDITVWFWGSVISSEGCPVAQILKEKICANEHMHVKFPKCKALDAAMEAAQRIAQ